MNRVRDYVSGMEAEEALEKEAIHELMEPNKAEFERFNRGIRVPLIGWEHSTCIAVKRWKICLTMARTFWHHSTIGQISGLAE